MSTNRLEQLFLTGLATTIVTALAPSAAFAHMGVGPVHDMLHGFTHPLTGLDHIAAMVAVGLWAAQRGGRALWLFPLTFAAAMAIGVMIGFAGVQLPYVEPGIIFSVIVLGILIATAVRLPDAAGAPLLGLFALCHGHVHGTEIPAAAYGVTYALGFLPATVILIAAGITFGRLTQRAHSSQLVRYAGGAIALTGIYLS